MKHNREWLIVVALVALVVLVKHFLFSEGTAPLYYAIDLLLLSGLGLFALFLYRIGRNEQKAAEIQRLLKQFKQTLDLTLDSIFIFDPDTLRFTYVNEGAIRQVGYTEAELLRMTPLEIKPEFTEARFREMVSPLIVGDEKHLKFETLHRHRNGRLIPVEIVLQYVRIYEGVSRFIAVVRDVSKRHKTEADLSWSQRSLQLFFEQSLDGIFFMMLEEPIEWRGGGDKDALMEYVFDHQHLTRLNQAMAQQYGMSVDEMLGKTPREFFRQNPEYGKKLWHDLFDAGRLGTVSREHRVDGMPMWIEGDYICLYDEVGRIIGHFGIQRDITVKKMALDELMQSEKRLELSIESAGQGTWEINFQTHQVAYGGKGPQMLGYEEGELPPLFDTWKNMLHPEDRERALETLEAHVKDGSFYKQEYRLRAKDGSYRWVLSTGKVIDYDEDGKPLRMAGIHMDIDEMKRLQLQLASLNATLEARVEEAVREQREQEQLLIRQSRMVEMGEMVAEIAHQWRQPLNTVSLTMQILESELQNPAMKPEDIRGMIATSNRQLEFMSQTIDGFRNFFRPDRKAAPFNAVEAVQEVAQVMAPQMEASEITYAITCRCGGSPESFEEAAADGKFVVEGYHNEFKQVVLNLLSNAKDAIVEHRKGAGAGYRGRVEIAVEKTPERLVVSIADNGGGIPDDVMDRIFDPYFTTKGGEQGSGIGLYMSRIIMERYMDGSVSAENVTGGAKFEIALRLGAPAQGDS